MLPGGRVDDHRFAAAGTLDLADTKSEALEPSPDLGRTQLDVQSVAFDSGHFCSGFRGLPAFWEIRPLQSSA